MSRLPTVSLAPARTPRKETVSIVTFITSAVYSALSHVISYIIIYRIIYYILYLTANWLSPGGSLAPYGKQKASTLYFCAILIKLWFGQKDLVQKPHKKISWRSLPW